MLMLCGLTVGCLGSVFGSKAAAGFARNLRQDQYDAIQTFSFSNIDRFSTPSPVTRLGADVMNIQNAFMMILRMVPRAASSKCSPNSATCRSPNGRSPSSRTGPQTSTAAMQRLATYRHTPSSASDSRACDAFSKRMPWMPTSLAPTMFLAVSSKNTQRSAVRPKRVRASS